MTNDFFEKVATLNSACYCRFFRKNSPRGCPRGAMVKAMDCGIVVSEFEHQSRHYLHFRTNTFEKGMNPIIPPAMG